MVFALHRDAKLFRFSQLILVEIATTRAIRRRVISYWLLLAEVAGLEPTTTESKSVVLPITLHLNIYKAQKTLLSYQLDDLRKVWIERWDLNPQHIIVCILLYVPLFISYFLLHIYYNIFFWKNQKSFLRWVTFRKCFSTFSVRFNSEENISSHLGRLSLAHRSYSKSTYGQVQVTSLESVMKGTRMR